jgi:hypothetical protein
VADHTGWTPGINNADGLFAFPHMCEGDVRLFEVMAEALRGNGVKPKSIALPTISNVRFDQSTLGPTSDSGCSSSLTAHGASSPVAL